MSEHTHLSSIEVNGDKITFKLTQHPEQAVAGLGISGDVNPDRLGAQLKALADASAITHEQAQEVADRSGLGDKLYTPHPKNEAKEEIAADSKDIVGEKTAAYLASKQAAQADAGIGM